MIKLAKFRSGLVLVCLAALVLLAVYANANVALKVRGAAALDDRLPVVAVPGYHVELFTKATAKQGVSNPDSVAVDGDHDRVFIDYQNVTSKTGGDGKTSTVVEYNFDGKWLKSWSVPGHSDGMRIDPATGKLWTTSNEDGNPSFALIDPTKNGASAVTAYTFPAPTPHGGGYDDLYFLGGKAYVAASNPSDSTHPGVDMMTLNSSTHTISLTPVLYDNAGAIDSISGNPVTLALTDPDSLSTDGKGDLVLVAQGDSQIVTIKHPGTLSQSVTVLTVGTQLDDTVYPSGPGRLLVVDAGGSTYWISKTTAFAPSSVYTQAPNDSGVTNFVGTVAPGTGFITPIAIGFTKATGMIFVPSED